MKTILIVGAARSGTHMLSKIIRENIGEDDCVYIGEINDFWNSFYNTGSDYIPSSMVEDSIINKIQKNLASIYNINYKDNKLIIEKTAANLFRLPLVCSVFPNSKIIHIIRDGRDVACSVRKKMMGDIRKITKIEDNIDRNKLFDLIRIIKYKLKNGISIKYFVANYKKYFRSALTILGIKKINKIWGPQFPGIIEYSKILSPIELAALQWRESVETVQNYLYANRNKINYLEVKYENIINNPDNELKIIFNYLGKKDENIKHNIIKKGETWKSVLNQTEKQKVAELIEFKLLQLGYEQTDIV